MVFVNELLGNQKPQSIKSQGARRREQRAAKRRIDDIQRDGGKMQWTVYAIHAYNQFFCTV
jgi:hypothetical protein